MASHPRPEREPEARPAFRPYVLWRRGTLAFDALASLVPTATWSMIDALEADARARAEAARTLADRLYAWVPRLEGSDRRVVLQLRRDLHNDRRLRARALSLASTLLGPTEAAALHRWSERREAAARELDRLQRIYEGEVEAARRRLGELAADDDFLAAIQLSGQGLYQSVLEYIDSARGSGTHPRNKNVRKTEPTLVRYAYRTALRTTPFGSFTEIGAQPWRAAPVRVVAEGPPRTRVVRLNRGLLLWMASALDQIDGADRLLSLRLNDTITRGDSLRAFTRGMDGDTRSYWSERFVSLPQSKPVAMVIEALWQGPVPRVEVFERLRRVGLPGDRVDAFLDTLVARGLVHQDLGLPDQTRDYAQQVAARLERVGTPEALHHAEIFTSLARLEACFGAAPAAERGRIMGRIHEQIERFTTICEGSSPPALQESPVWEDVGTRSPSRGWDPALLERNVEPLSRLQRIIPLFDEMGPQRLGLYRWFSQRYGEDGRCDDLLEVYRAFASQPQRAVAQVMQAEHDPHAQTIVELRYRFLQRIHEALEHSDGAATLQLDARLFDQTIDQLAPWVPRWDSAAYWLQLVPESRDRSASVVINNVATGHGAYYSRFCELFEGRGTGEWSLGAAIRDSIHAQNPRQADLTAVLGINVNLHPHLSPLELVYPGAVATTGAEALTVRDLGIAADPCTRRLRLYTRADGLPVDLVPLNFLFPAAAPMLYRFLCALGTSHHVRLQLWDRVRMVFAPHRTHFPRLRLGELVLERRSWFLPARELAFLGGGTRLPSLELLQQADRWRRARGLPAEAFIRGVERPPRETLDEGWAKATRQWALEARSARRKPQYVELRNPFLVRILASVARSSPEGGIIVTECLPPTSIYTQEAGSSSAEEFLVELSTRGPRREQGR